jgi:drug/metabolite transporter (DMT)-like permease
MTEILEISAGEVVSKNSMAGDRSVEDSSCPEQLRSSSLSTTSALSESTDISTTRSRVNHIQPNDSVNGGNPSGDPKDLDDLKEHSLARHLWRNAFLSIIQITNIFLWYYTNGMNGIAMESFAKKFRENTLEQQMNRSLGPSSFLVWETLHILSTTCFVTSRQLLVGAAIGRFLLFLMNPAITWDRIRSSHWGPLSMLHALGSLATNLGFMYGKASVIQVLKLLEPFETLLLSQLFFREGTFTVGIVSSMLVVVGGAMSLLRLQSKPPAAQAVVAALASGLLLSCRNVLQRKHQTHNLQQQQTSNDVLPIKNTPHSQPELTKLEKSVVQFTQLSFYSGIYISLVYLPLWFWSVHSMKRGDEYDIDNTDPNIQVYLWHPLYNIFSMITLGFCSALTHSLLNAGKRVFAICMAMLWFHEGLNDPAKIAGLLTVAFGGCWYSAESKAAKSKK